MPKKESCKLATTWNNNNYCWIIFFRWSVLSCLLLAWWMLLLIESSVGRQAGFFFIFCLFSFFKKWKRNDWVIFAARCHRLPLDGDLHTKYKLAWKKKTQMTDWPAPCLLHFVFLFFLVFFSLKQTPKVNKGKWAEKRMHIVGLFILELEINKINLQRPGRP